MSNVPDPNVLTAEAEAEILRARAVELARAPEDAEIGESLEILRFTLAQEHYAVEVRYVEEVAPFGAVTPVPCTPRFLLGIMNVRGRIVSVVDVKRFFGLPDRGLVDLNRVLVLREGDMEFGVLADEVVGVQEVSLDRLQPPLATLSGIRQEYLRGIGPGALVVLDGGALLRDPRLVVDEEVRS